MVFHPWTLPDVTPETRKEPIKRHAKKLPPPFPVPFSESNPTPNVTSNTPHPPAVPPAGSGHYLPTPSSQPKTTSSYHVTSPAPIHSHFPRAVPNQPPPFPEPSTGHHHQTPVTVGPSVSRTPGGASVAQAGNYFQQGQPAQARNYSQQGQPAQAGNYFQQGQPAQAGNYFQQGQPATSNFTQTSNPMGGGAPPGMPAQQAPVRVPCKLCGSLRRNAGMDDSSEFCSEECKWAWRTRRTQHPS